MIEGPPVDNIVANTTLQEWIITGLDEIPPTFLKSLGLKALNESLEIYNLSFLYANFPNIWQVATIIVIQQLLKAGKFASEIASY